MIGLHWAYAPGWSRVVRAVGRVSDRGRRTAADRSCMLVLDGPSANPDRLFAPLERSSIVQLDPIPVTDPPPRPPRGRGSGRACGPRRVLRLVVALLLVAASAHAQEGPAALGETLGYAELLTLVGDAPSVQVAELALERAAR